MTYPDPYNSAAESFYWGGDPLLPARCPVCNSPNGQCVGDVSPPLTYSPVDIPPGADRDRATSPLRLYRVTQYGFTTIMQLDDADAAFYGADAVLI